jgi:enterochelin esterase-like enzyme
MIRSGLTATTWALLRRARTLYVMTVAMTFAFVGLATWTDLQLWVDRASGLGAESWGDLLTRTLTLRYAYHGSDILAIYTLLLAATPVILFFLRAGYGRWVLLGSWLLWAGHALFPAEVSIWPIENSWYFPLAAWQMVFITGLVMGHARATVERERRGTPRSLAMAALPWVAVAAVLLLLVAWTRAVNPFQILPESSFRPTGLEHEQWAVGYWDKVTLGPGRLAVFSALAIISYAVLTYAWKPVERAVGWLLLPLGAGSLTVYATHLFLVVGGYNLGVLGLNEPELILQNTMGQIALVLIIWALVQLPDALRDTASLMRSTLRRLHRSRSLAGCLTAALFLLLIAHEPVLSAPRVPDVEAQVQLPPFTSPIGSRPSGQNPSVLPPSATTDELLKLGYTSTREGPRSIPLRAGQLIPNVFTSTTLERRMPYYVYLPPGYDSGTRSYPVVYLLHGYYGSFMEWAEVGIHQAADAMILAAEIQPMIIVMPEGEQSYYVNQGPEGQRWGDYIWDDVVREVDSTYRTIASPRARAIGGLSMGGTGALQIAFTHPDVFGIVGAHAPTLKWERPEDKFSFADDDYYRTVNPLVLADERDDLGDLTIGLDVGEEDWEWFTVDALHGILDSRDIEHTFEFLPGGHAAEYWIEHQGVFLRFYSEAFQARGQ